MEVRVYSQLRLRLYPYVAMTRAKDHLHLIVPQRFYSHQQQNRGSHHMYAIY
jgi:ATP-dependent exoDNAse (exonuclease V) beta subunit